MISSICLRVEGGETLFGKISFKYGSMLLGASLTLVAWLLMIYYNLLLNRQLEAKMDLSLVDKIELGRLYEKHTG